MGQDGVLMVFSSAEFHTNSVRIPRTELRTNSLRLVTCGGHGSAVMRRVAGVQVPRRPPWILGRGCRLRPRQQQLQHSVLGAGKPRG